GGQKNKTAMFVSVESGDFTSAIEAVGDIEGLTSGTIGGFPGSTYLIIKPLNQTRHLKLLRWTGLIKDQEFFRTAAQASAKPIDLSPLTKGGPARWGDPLITKGKLGSTTTDNGQPTTDQPYIVDTLTAPEENPFKSYLRFSGHDFFKNGDM